MAILSADEYREAIKNMVGDSTEDSDIQFIENMTDTYESLSTKAKSNEAESWKRKYEDLQTKYKERFFSPNPESAEPEFEDDKPNKLTFDNLFKEN